MSISVTYQLTKIKLYTKITQRKLNYVLYFNYYYILLLYYVYYY